MSEQGSRVTVALEDGPAVTLRSKKWQWVAAIVVLAVLGAGVAIWFLQARDPEYRPPVIEGLTEEPDYSWQLALDEEQDFAVIGETIAIHPSRAARGQLSVTMVEPETGEELWHQDYSEYLPDSRARSVWLNNLPGTDRMAIRLAPGDGAAQLILFADRATGEIVESREIPADTQLITTNAGTYLLLTEGAPGSGFQEMALLQSDDPDDALWSIPFTYSGDLERVSFREHEGYLAVTSDVPGFWTESTHRVVTMTDGTRPDWVPDDYATVHFFPGIGVVTRAGTISGHDLESGDELWRIGDEDRGAWSVGGNLFELRTDEEGLQVMRLDITEGSPLWDEPLVMPQNETQSVGDFRNLTLAGDELVAIGLTGPSTADDLQTCLSVIDADTGEADQWRCHDVDGLWSWGGVDQIILWDGSTLAAAGLREDELRWSKYFTSVHVEVRDVGGDLLVNDQSRHVIGVLE